MVGVSSLLIIIYYFGRYVESAEDFNKSCISLANYVDCANKKLDVIPSNIPEWTSSLNLNNNHIYSLDGAQWKNLSKLLELKLNKNKLRKIHQKTFDNMNRLTLLELNRNQIEEIEALSFQPLEQVTVLKLRRNRIKNLPDGTFFGLKKIKVLLLDYNFVQVIKKSWLYNLENLKELSISNNAIHTVDNDAWEFCKGLVELDLAYNQLKSIKRDTLKDLVHLQKLYLNNNNITFIEEHAFSHTPNLQILNLSNNRISYTIEDTNGFFGSLTALQKFSIASNDIKLINKYAFSGLSDVIHLDLNNNNITSIQMNAFSEMPDLEELLINTTALLCDCNLQWFYEYLKLKSLNVTTVCTYPDWLQGIPLQNVPANNFTCDDLPKPRLIEEPGVEIMALKGGDISLVCRAMSSSTSKMSFVWKKDDVELRQHVSKTIENEIDLKTIESLSYLNISNVQHSDAGKYQCIVSNSFGTTYSKKSNISVLIYPKFIKIPSNITVQAGTAAKLVCSASGEPQPEVAWTKDGGNDFPAARERRMQVMPQDDVFFIINTKQADMGVYSCIAHNTAGKIVANATLNIEEKPSFVRPMEDKEVTAGESVVIQCMASGAPKPTIQWLKDGVPITATERHFFTAEEELMIIVDTILNDGGVYTCKLNNSLGTETGYSTIIVKPVLTPYSDMLGIIIITVVSCAVLTSGIWVVIIYHTRRRMAPLSSIKSPNEPIMFDLTEKMVNHFGDNTSEHSSCKDSGTGDSAKRSNDDLLPGDEYTLIINDANPSDKTTMRTASLIYLPADAKNVHTPLLHESSPSYSRSTNHDRLTTETVEEIDINAITPADEVKD